MLSVVKVGGGRLASARDRRAVADRLAALPGHLVVVHGGGAQISRWQERLGVPVRRVDGLRVTRGEGLQVASMVLSGWINKRLTAACLDRGLPAVGVSGEDGGLIRAGLRDGGRLGSVGRVEGVGRGVIRALLAQDFVPVVSPMARGPAGEPLNVNADEAAAALAGALAADRLLLVSDVPGVLREGRVVPEVDARTVSGPGPAATGSPTADGAGADAEEMGEGGRGAPSWVAGGMLVKVRAGGHAAGRGVDVRIGDLGLLEPKPGGTRVVAGARAGKGGGDG